MLGQWLAARQVRDIYVKMVTCRHERGAIMQIEGLGEVESWLHCRHCGRYIGIGVRYPVTWERELWGVPEAKEGE